MSILGPTDDWNKVVAKLPDSAVTLAELSKSNPDPNKSRDDESNNNHLQNRAEAAPCVYSSGALIGDSSDMVGDDRPLYGADGKLLPASGREYIFEPNSISANEEPIYRNDGSLDIG